MDVAVPKVTHFKNLRRGATFALRGFPLRELSVPEFMHAKVPQSVRLSALPLPLHRPDSQCVLIHCPQKPNENKLELSRASTKRISRWRVAQFRMERRLRIFKTPLGVWH